MAVTIVQVPGGQIVQKDQEYANIAFSDQEGVIYNPNPDIEGEQDAYFSHNIAPPITDNFAWNNIKLNYTYNRGEVPDIFQAWFTLEGILLDGSLEVIGQQTITSIPATPTTGEIYFDLYNNRSKPSFKKKGVIGTSGKVMLLLPRKWLYFESINLVKNFLGDWNGRRRYTITNNSSTDYSEYRARIVVPYLTMNSDFSDLRFCDSDGKTLLCYGREYYISSSMAVFTVIVPNLGAGESRTIYVYYNKPSATYQGNMFTVANKFDNWEDGKVSGRSHPYSNWGSVNCTLSIESGSPISENYSMNVTGGGTTESFAPTGIPSGLVTNYRAEFDFKLKSPGSGTYAPWIDLWWKRAGINDMIRAYAYWTGSNTSIQFRKSEAGSGTAIKIATWLSGKIPTGKVYHCTIIDTGSRFQLYIDETLIINESYSYKGSTPTNYGVGCGYNGVATFDNLSIHKTQPNVTVSGIGGTAEGGTPIPLEVTTENYLFGYFTIPASWVDPSDASLEIKEINTDTYRTNEIPVSVKDNLELGMNGVDRYQGLRLGLYLHGDRNCNFRINNLSYAYEVI